MNTSWTLAVLVVGMLTGGAIVAIVKDAWYYERALSERGTSVGDALDDILPDPDEDLIVPADVALDASALRELVDVFEMKNDRKPRRVLIERVWDFEGVEVVYLDFVSRQTDA